MEEKIKAAELLKSIFNSLSDEQKAKARKCTTAEELIAFFSNEEVSIPDEMLEQVSGGKDSVNKNGGFEDLIRLLTEKPEMTPEEVIHHMFFDDPTYGWN